MDINAFIYYLAQHKILTQEQIQLCENLAVAEQLNFGQALISLGYLSQDHLKHYLEQFKAQELVVAEKKGELLSPEEIKEEDPALLSPTEEAIGPSPLPPAVLEKKQATERGIVKEIDNYTKRILPIEAQDTQAQASDKEIADSNTMLDPLMHTPRGSSVEEQETMALNQNDTFLAPPMAISNKASEERYEVLEILGQGGMGVVERVKDTLLGREVALKTIRSGEIGLNNLNKKQQLMLWRLNREASITAILEHPNIVPLHDMQRKSNGELSFTMRKIEGKNLAEILKQKNSGEEDYDEDRLLSIFYKTCDAVSYAHSKGVIHRDLKPENIMVGQFGEVYVMDWGIAKELADTSKDRLEETGEITPAMEQSFQTIGGMGTPGYMAPEQAKNASEVKPQADIYSLGRILRQLFILVSPSEEVRYEIEWQRNNAEQAYKKEQRESSFEKRLPPDVKAIIEKASKNNWQQRYQEVQQLTEDVKRYQKHIRVSVRKYNPFELFFKWLKRNRKVIAVFGMILLVCFAFVFYINLKKWERFDTAYQKSKKEQKLAQKETLEKKIEYLLNSLNSANIALSLKPKNKQVEEIKFAIGTQLIRLACQTQDYQLANYIVTDMQPLFSISKTEKKALKKLVKTEKEKILKQHLVSLEEWIEKLKSKELKENVNQDAIFEISKMTEKEIFKKLLEILAEGTTYYLEGKERTAILDLYYQTMAQALRRLERSEAAKDLLQSLEKMKVKAITFPQGQRPLALLDYMVFIAEGLLVTNEAKMVTRFRELRQEMGANGVFWNRTIRVYEKIRSLESLKSESLNSVRDYLKRASAKIEKNAYEEALLDINKAIRFNPKLADAYLQRGIIMSRLHRLDEAMADLKKTIDLNPNSYDAFYYRAEARKKNEDLEGALLDIKKVLSLNPNHYQAFFLQGSIKTARKDFLGALKDYNLCLKLHPQYDEAYIARGLAHYSLKKNAAALKDFDEAIRLNPKRATAYNNRGLVKRDLGDLDGAIEDWGQAILYFSNFVEAYTNRGLAKEKKGDLEGALLDIEEAIRLTATEGKYKDIISKARRYCYLGKIKAAKKEYQEAIEAYSLAIQWLPQEPAFYDLRGDTYKLLHEFGKATADYSEGLRLFKTAHRFALLADAKNKDGKSKSALLDIEQAISLNKRKHPHEVKTLATYHILKGNILIAQNKNATGIKSFDQAIQLAPKIPDYYDYRGDAKKNIGDFKGAITDYSLAIKLTPSHSHRHALRASARSYAKDFEGAIKDYTIAIRFGTEARVSNQVLGKYYAARGRVRSDQKLILKAIQDYSKALQLDPNNSIYYNFRGDAYRIMNQIDDAIVDYTSGIKIQPKNPFRYALRGDAKRQKKDYSAAILDFDRAIELDPKFAKAYQVRGEIKALLGKKEEAQKDFALARRLDPRFAKKKN